MYPKLKVRSQEQAVRYGDLSNPSLPGLKGLNSFFHGDFSFPAKKKDAKTLKAELPASKNLGSSKNKNERGEEDSRPHIRASPIPRPRAVLSSPINDDMIGSNTKQTQDRSSSLNPRQLVHKCNLTTNHSASGSRKSGLEVSEEATKTTEIRKPRRNVTLKHSVAEQSRDGRQTPDGSNIRGNKGSVAMNIRNN